MPSQSNWYSDHPAACQCQICSDIRNIAKGETKDTESDRYLEEQYKKENIELERRVASRRAMSQYKKKTNKFWSKRLIFGLVVLVIAVVALIYDFQKSNESTSLTLDNAMLQQYVDTKIKQIDGLIDGQATISEPVPAISQTPSSYLNTPVPPRSIFAVIGSYLPKPDP